MVRRPRRRARRYADQDCAHLQASRSVEIAKANNIQPQATLNIGEQIVIPGLRAASVQHKETTKVAEAKPAAVPAKSKTVVAARRRRPRPESRRKQAAVTTSEPTQTAAVLTPANETPTATTGAVKSAEGAPPSFRWPVKARVIAGFGPRPNGQQNDGINLAVPEDTPVKAAEDGVVAYAGNELKGYGNLVLVRHPNGYVTAYAHAKELMVKRGDQIKRGQVIAKSGQTGNVDAPQLHFEIRKGPAPIDPMPIPQRRVKPPTFRSCESDVVPDRAGTTVLRLSRHSFTPSRPARSCTYCHATRPERAPRVVAHSSASRCRSSPRNGMR